MGRYGLSQRNADRDPDPVNITTGGATVSRITDQITMKGWQLRPLDPIDPVLLCPRHQTNEEQPRVVIPFVRTRWFGRLGSTPTHRGGLFVTETNSQFFL